MSDTVIAKYAPVRFGLGYAFFLVLLGLTWADIFRAPVRTEVLWIIIVAIVTLLVLRASATILVQAIRHGGRAIWIEDGRLRYPDSGRMIFTSVPVNDVQDVSIVPGGFFRPTRIAIRVQGGVDYIKTYFFHPSAELICARLSEALVSVKAARGGL